jgi:ligand-binding SRPBCC domain-containing protein
MNFAKESIIEASPERVFAFHELPDALARLTPPWESARVIQSPKDLNVGSTAIIETRILGLIRTRWVAKHTAYEPPRMFEDVQTSGPFHSWRHRHIVEPHERGAVLRDEIEYEPPLGFIGRLGAPLIIVPRLRRLFDYRHRVTREWAEQQEKEDRSQETQVSRKENQKKDGF